ncbi:MAG: hypothetical protein WCR82_02965 [Bacteroidales bacterium]
MDIKKSGDKGKWCGIALTVAAHAALLLLCVSSVLKYNYPPPKEYGILMEFNQVEEKKPVEVAAGKEPRAKEANPKNEVKLVQQSKAQQKGSKLNKAIESTVEKDGDVEVPEPPRKKEIDKRALFSSADNNKKDTLAAQTSDRISNALTAGHSQGNTEVGATDGEPSAKLTGRSIMGSLPLPNYNVQKSGRVVVKITVTREGKVSNAIPGFTGTTVMDKTLWEASKNAALKAQFNLSSSAPLQQEGTITYIFNLK